MNGFNAILATHNASEIENTPNEMFKLYLVKDLEQELVEVIGRPLRLSMLSSTCSYILEQ